MIGRLQIFFINLLHKPCYQIVMLYRKPNRLPGYDYSRDNLYFITTCVDLNICCFGRISSNQIVLTRYGEIAQELWYWLGNQYPYARLHAFAVMPNHLHGIIEINRNMLIKKLRSVKAGIELSGSTNTELPKIKSISELVGAYKSSVSKNIHLSGYEGFKWQRSFYEHIIRNEKSYMTITDYIINNPAKWRQDRFYGDNFI